MKKLLKVGIENIENVIITRHFLIDNEELDVEDVGLDSFDPKLGLEIDWETLYTIIKSCLEFGDIKGSEAAKSKLMQKLFS